MPGFQVLACQICDLIVGYFHHPQTQESEENFIKQFICSSLPAVSMGTSVAAARAVTGPSWIQRDLRLQRECPGGPERTFVGLWMFLAGPHFCLERSRFKSILLRCSGTFVHEEASASSVPHLTFWKFLESLILHPNLLKKNKKQSKIPGMVYTPVFPALGKQGRRVPTSRIAGAT